MLPIHLFCRYISPPSPKILQQFSYFEVISNMCSTVSSKKLQHMLGYNESSIEDVLGYDNGEGLMDRQS